MREVYAKPGIPIDIGKQGENTTAVYFDITSMLEEYPDGVIALLHRRPKDEIGTPVSGFSVEGNTGIWMVSKADTKYDKDGEAELVLVQDDMVRKSITFDTIIHKSVGSNNADPTPPYQGWEDAVLQAAAEAKAARDEIVESAEQIETNRQNIESLERNKVNEPTREGEDGQVLATDGAGGRIWKTVSGMDKEIEDILFRSTGYEKIQKKADYLYECWYDKLDYGTAFDYFKKNGYFPTAGCSGLAAKNSAGKSFLGRNFDWFYSNEAEFVVHVSAIMNNDEYVRHASVGVATGLEIENDKAEDMKADKAYVILPFAMLDGVNDCGVAVSINVVPTYTEEGKANTIVLPAIESRVELSASMIIRYVLDNFDNAESAVEFIRDYATVYFPKRSHDMGYELHFIIMDNDNRYVVEFENNETVILDCDEDLPFPVMTNFHLNNVVFNATEEFPIYTPYLNDGTHDAETTNHIEPLGSGLERYNIICGEVQNLGTDFGANDIAEIMRKVIYTKSYPTSPIAADPLWYTEFVGGDVTCGKNPDAYTDALAQAGTAYSERSRDTAITWQTCHSVVYDLENKTLSLCAQEDTENEYAFELNIERAAGLPVVTPTDAGKVLEVGDDGTFVAANGNIYISFSVDKSSEQSDGYGYRRYPATSSMPTQEILTLVNKYKNRVYATYMDIVFPLVDFGPSYAVWDVLYYQSELAIVASSSGTSYETMDYLMGEAFMDRFSTTTQYNAGDYVIKGTDIYKCTSDHIGNWVASHFTKAKPIKEIEKNKVNEPTAEGTNGQMLTTDGQGGRTWSTVSGIEVTSGSPTNPNTEVVIDPDVTETFSVPEIDDENTSVNDTWSSDKISNEINDISDAIDRLPQDVKIDGTSIVDSDGIANIPYATSSASGLARAGTNGGLLMGNDGQMYTNPASNGAIDTRTDTDSSTPSVNTRNPITPAHLNYAVTAALTDSKHITLTAEQQAIAKQVLGITAGGGRKLLFDWEFGQDDYLACIPIVDYDPETHIWEISDEYDLDDFSGKSSAIIAKDAETEISRIVNNKIVYNLSGNCAIPSIFTLNTSSIVDSTHFTGSISAQPSEAVEDITDLRLVVYAYSGYSPYLVMTNANGYDRYYISYHGLYVKNGKRFGVFANKFVEFVSGVNSLFYALSSMSMRDSMEYLSSIPYIVDFDVTMYKNSKGTFDGKVYVRTVRSKSASDKTPQQANNANSYSLGFYGASIDFSQPVEISGARGMWGATEASYFGERLRIWGEKDVGV